MGYKKGKKYSRTFEEDLIEDAKVLRNIIKELRRESESWRHRYLTLEKTREDNEIVRSRINELRSLRGDGDYYCADYAAREALDGIANSNASRSTTLQEEIIFLKQNAWKLFADEIGEIPDLIMKYKEMKNNYDYLEYKIDAYEQFLERIGVEPSYAERYFD